MHQSNDIELEKLHINKEVRREIRLKWSLKADAVLHDMGIPPATPRRYTPTQKAAIKRQRSLVNATHSRSADEEIAAKLPEIQQQFDDAVQAGVLLKWYGLDVGLAHERDLKILDFDCEVRPMAYYGGDYCTKELTACAWRFIGQKTTHCWLLTPSETHADHQAKRRDGILRFISAYNRADIVTGHYIRGFDLPVISAHCIELGLPPLKPKLSHDTKGDLITMSGLSKSQENLAAKWGAGKKEGMNTTLWEMANSLVREGRAETKRRVVGDVEQHIVFRQALIDAHALTPPKLWSSGARMEDYQP